ncbi:hypothetical protein [Streptomyces sp. NBC_00467]|uniref:hypothetical protein n=1 Tax=Streptomyces sp. NBC_00467 TaxID=2975752 RepID=UPI002E198CE9
MSQVLALAGSIVIVAAGTGRADQVPFPDSGGASFSGAVHPGEYVATAVKGRPGNPHPSGVDVSSPALEEGIVLGDTGRAWVGAAHALSTVEPGTYRVKFTLTYRDVPCWNEEDRDSVCDYDPTVVWSELHVEAHKEKAAGGWGFAPGAVLGAAAATVTTASVMFMRRRVPKSARSL